MTPGTRVSRFLPVLCQHPHRSLSSPSPESFTEDTHQHATRLLWPVGGQQHGSCTHQPVSLDRRRRETRASSVQSRLGRTGFHGLAQCVRSLALADAQPAAAVGLGGLAASGSSLAHWLAGSLARGDSSSVQCYITSPGQPPAAHVPTHSLDNLHSVRTPLPLPSLRFPSPGPSCPFWPRSAPRCVAAFLRVASCLAAWLPGCRLPVRASLPAFPFPPNTPNHRPSSLLPPNLLLFPCVYHRSLRQVSIQNVSNPSTAHTRPSSSLRARAAAADRSQSLKSSSLTPQVCRCLRHPQARHRCHLLQHLRPRCVSDPPSPRLSLCRRIRAAARWMLTLQRSC